MTIAVIVLGAAGAAAFLVLVSRHVVPPQPARPAVEGTAGDGHDRRFYGAATLDGEQAHWAGNPQQRGGQR